MRGAAICDKPFRCRLGVVPVTCRIERRRRVGMERAYPNFGRIAGNAKPILMFRFLVMHTHLIGSHHDKHKLTGRIIHRPAPRLRARASVDRGRESEVNAAGLPVLQAVPAAVVELPAFRPFPDRQQPVAGVRSQCVGQEWSAPLPNNAARADGDLPVKTLHLSRKSAERAPADASPFRFLCARALGRVSVRLSDHVAAAGTGRPVFPCAPGLRRVRLVARRAGLDLAFG